MLEVAFAIRLLLALVFIFAAVGKARHRMVFEGVVANYRLLPEIAVPAFALLLPTVEIAVAGALVLVPPFWPEASAAALLLLFAAAMAVNIRRGRRHIDCGCFQSALKQTLSWTLVGRNVGLALLLVVPAVVPEGGMSAWRAANAVSAGIVLFVLMQSLNILWSVVPAWRLGRAITTGAEK